MAASLPYADKPFIVFSDFDGTITTRDSNDCATDELGFGVTRRRELNLEILNGTKTFRDAFKEMLDSVCENGHSFDSVVEYLRKEIKLDPGFKVFFDYCKQASIPVVIVSSGMVPIIRAILENLIGPEDAKQISIIANDVKHLEGGKWTISYLHPETGFGHDKSRATAPYRELEHEPTLFFCGDGVSDLSAARAADLLFVKVIEGHTNDLKVHCDREKIPYVPFSQFEQVGDVVKSVVEKQKTVQEHLDAKK
ncbi:putative phosphoric monoester hydrolase [Sporobolomyces salmoneus]|uniref:putative phosphoric monoester hydrolase n=1 Tax=Sporobolomyces salmoneus TaxID=183962 RepID=UPI003179B103